MSDLWEREDSISKQQLEKITKSKINNFDYIKLKRYCNNKNNNAKIKRQATNWETIFVMKNSDKDLITQIYKEVYQLYKKPSHPPIENG